MMVQSDSNKTEENGTLHNDVGLISLPPPLSSSAEISGIDSATDAVRRNSNSTYENCMRY
jgi:hypothetical protein